MKEKLEVIRERVLIYTDFANSAEVIDEHGKKASEALALLDSLIAELESAELVEKVADNICYISHDCNLVAMPSIEEIEKESAKREIISGDIFDSFPPELAIMDEPDNEGWIEVPRSGIVQPVKDNNIIVEVKWSTTQIERGLAGSYDWSNSGACIPIIAYRILPNQTPEELDEAIRCAKRIERWENDRRIDVEKEKIPTLKEYIIPRLKAIEAELDSFYLLSFMSSYLYKYMMEKR